MSIQIGYIAQVDLGPDYPVKIGRSENPANRIRGIQTSNPNPVRLVAMIRGGKDMEEELKSLLSDCRLSGEWYRPCQKLVGYIDKAFREERLLEYRKPTPEFIDAHLVPLALEYLKGREPNNNSHGDLVFRLLSGRLPSAAPRAEALSKATQGKIPAELARGFISASAPTRSLLLPDEANGSVQSREAAA